MQPTPTAWLHTLHMEGGQIQERLLSWGPGDPNSDPDRTGFGVRGEDFDPSYTVTMTPLYAGQPPAQTVQAALPPQPHVCSATVRSAELHGWYVDCDFISSGKEPAVRVDEDKPWLAEWIAAALCHAYSAQARKCPVCRRPLREHPAPHLGASCDHCEMAFTEEDITSSWKP